MTDPLRDQVMDLYERRHSLTNVEWLEAAPVLLGISAALFGEPNIRAMYGELIRQSGLPKTGTPWVGELGDDGVTVQLDGEVDLEALFLAGLDKQS
jgi:hypothetical protein